MKKQHYVIINLLFVGMILFATAVVLQFMTGHRALDIVASLWQREPEHVSTQQCQTRKPLQKLEGAGHESIKRLAVYQQACHSFVTDTVMIFFAMATTQKDAVAYAAQDAKMLQVFAAAGVRPIMIIEPTDKEGVQLDFERFARGEYDGVTKAYFTELKKQGITDKQLGIVTPFPEANLPYWNNNKPSYFAPAINRHLGIVRQQFPKAETSVLLNSATYDVDDFNWENGDYNSLLPYVDDVRPELVTYAGLQGFPWVSRQGGSGVIFNAAEFLNPQLLEEMAAALETKKVWFNTGTFQEKYALDPQQTRTISLQQRKEIIMTIRQQAVRLKQKGYSISVNLFAEDKSEASEETDWSYWQGNDPFASQSTPIFTSFAKELAQEDIPLWLFDR